MKSSGQILKAFQEADLGTIIRKPNLRRLCASNDIHLAINNDLHKPLYDFNELLMKVTQKVLNARQFLSRTA
jgi:hypothetical protein